MTRSRRVASGSRFVCSSWFSAAVCASGLALLSACASQSPPMTATQEAATYQARAKPSYSPPGPPSDPWGPFIVEAANRFDVPERWIREVMRVESGAHEFNASGALITSPVGAMGLMQLMPETYDEVRAQYNLGDDAFDPHNNIMAGTAYIRQMYDAFGTPGFLAAYNGGPARLEDYLVHQRPLPSETRRYVAMIGPYIEGIYPQSRSPAEQLAVNQIPINIRPARATWCIIPSWSPRASGMIGAGSASMKSATPCAIAAAMAPGPVELAEAPPPRSAGVHTVRVAYAMPAHHNGGFSLISSAEAAEPIYHGARKGAHQKATKASSHTQAPTQRMPTRPAFRTIRCTPPWPTSASPLPTSRPSTAAAKAVTAAAPPRRKAGVFFSEETRQKTLRHGAEPVRRGRRAG